MGGATTPLTPAILESRVDTTLETRIGPERAEREVMGRQNYLGELEQMVLWAVLRLDGDGYGTTILEALTERVDRPQRLHDKAHFLRAGGALFGRTLLAEVFVQDLVIERFAALPLCTPDVI